MALTPEDVVNKRFQPTKFREGYDQDEVDDFLDEVVVELRRLHQENEELRQRLSSGDAAPAATTVIDTPVPAPAAVEQAPVAVEPEPAPVVAQAPAAPAADEDDETSSTSSLLKLARKLHEEHVREGVEKRDALVAEAHATAARIAAEAEAEQRSKTAALEKERQVLEGRIDELRTFEREYRTKLKGYIEGQLRELDSAGSSEAPATASFGN
ncbi:DivIVA domain-containing protein [Clavibacter nebraskensis]|uniref:Cell wall synthesis protein Wag31 n=2 Tax=Clavibacter nebraskensis TaxID=31963 RepID=A0A399QDF6_9MICO|nr:DivIVA domain-containing protein [Clavibacter nebraskensis]KXU20408.1 cell division protein [Clavibacter nebraskensis]OAH20776.1 cell division protein [Clavibacter nebraskensis]QGV66969.1 DivIVA domain-containing protein [Clavibacter nebraskensis]QGV69770.1 DivIVA domain-containing protein [Clavibacter nebraskensis]QGV72561.1 DivIVA domain-containing protein [Clavibacter nebraskensis]